MKHLYVLLLFTSIVFISCSEDEVDPNPITVSQVGEQLNLLNNTSDTLYYFLVDQNTLAVINWAPSVNDNQENIDPNGQARIPLTEVTGYSTETEVIVVYYWRAIMENDELAPGPVDHILFEF